jgi:hypothetical protein
MTRDAFPAAAMILLVLFFIFNLSCRALAEVDRNDSELPSSVPRVSVPVKVDGVLEESEWKDALLLELKYETQPGENIPAMVRTEVLVTYDDGNVYFAFRCFDPDPSAIRARYADRDDIIGDDLIHVNLDTFNDERRNYFFGVNALGIQRDGIETKYGDTTWDAIWSAAGRITEWGYAIEMAIPFATLQFPRSESDQVWGLDLSRLYPRSKMYRFGLVPMDRNNDSYQSQFLKIVGFAGVNPGRNLEINPTMTTVKTDAKESLPDGDFVNRDAEVEFGVTAKWGITNNLTMSATVNPDFSQVEADARQLDINEPFALFYMEKRPFFTEGVDFFDTGGMTGPLVQAIYTRTLRNPDWGIKLTGKEGSNSLGAYFVRDTLTNLIFPGSQGSSATSLDMASDAAAFRYKRDFGNRYTLGAVFTNRDGDEYYNRVLGVDANIRVTDKDRLLVQYYGSFTKYPSAVSEEFDQPKESFSDGSLNVYYQHSSRDWNWWGGFWDQGDGFRADLGFMPQVGYRHYNAGGEYHWIGKPGGWWSMFIAGTGYNRLFDRSGELLLSNHNYWVNYSGAMQSYVQFRGSRDSELYNGVMFDINRFVLSSSAQPTSYLGFGFHSQFGDRIDYVHTRAGNRLNINPEFSYRLGRHLTLNFGHNYERMTVEGDRLYTANISQGTVIYQFSPRMFFRSILQFVDYDYNLAMYAEPRDPEFRQLFTQLLFSYKINPRTVLFLGYSDNYFGNQDFGLTQSDRTFFVKLGYAWIL